MGKLSNMILFLSVLVLLFHYAGLVDDSTLLSLLLDPQSMSQMTFMDLIADALVLVISAGAVIGLFAAQKPELAIKAGIVSYLLILGWDFIVVWQKVSEVSQPLAILVISPLMITFLIAAVEWWGGHD